MGTVPGLPLFKEVLDDYHNIHFINPDGSFNMELIGERTTGHFKERGAEEFRAAFIREKRISFYVLSSF